MEKRLPVLKDHQVGIWCKRAAWILLTCNIIHVCLFYFQAFFFDNQTHSVSLTLRTVEWLNLFQTLASSVAVLLFNFFLLYAAGVVVQHLAEANRK
jgi:hypothetical protein